MVTRAYLVTTQFEMIVGQDTETINRLFTSIDDARVYANDITIADLVCAAIDEDIDLHDIGAVAIEAREFNGSQTVGFHTLRQCDYAELIEAGFQNPPAEVLDGFVPSPAV
jgi:hypothetical protein